MRTEYYPKIKVEIELTRKVAEKLHSLVKNDKDFEDIVDQIDRKLRPIYTYTLPCIGCGNKCEWRNDIKITNEEAKKKWGTYTLCQKCFDSEDFK